MPSLLVFQCPQEKLNLLLLHTQMKSVNRALCSELEKVHRQCTCCPYDGLESIHNLIPLEKRSCQGIEGRVRCPLPELPGLVKTTNSREMHSCRNIYFHAYTLSVCRFFWKNAMHCITYSRQNLLYEKDYFLREIHRNESFKTKNFDSIKFVDKVPSRACLDFPYHLFCDAMCLILTKSNHLSCAGWVREESACRTD